MVTPPRDRPRDRPRERRGSGRGRREEAQAVSEGEGDSEEEVWEADEDPVAGEWGSGGAGALVRGGSGVLVRAGSGTKPDKDAVKEGKAQQRKEWKCREKERELFRQKRSGVRSAHARATGMRVPLNNGFAVGSNNRLRAGDQCDLHQPVPQGERQKSTGAGGHEAISTAPGHVHIAVVSRGTQTVGSQESREGPDRHGVPCTCDRRRRIILQYPRATLGVPHSMHLAWVGEEGAPVKGPLSGRATTSGSSRGGGRWGVSPAAQMGCLRNRSGSPSGADLP